MPPSARARRSAASSARREISVPVNGSRIRWTPSPAASRRRRCGERPAAGRPAPAPRRPRSADHGRAPSLYPLRDKGQEARRRTWRHESRPCGGRRCGRRRRAGWRASGAAGSGSRRRREAVRAAPTRRPSCRCCRAPRTTRAAPATTSSFSSIRKVAPSTEASRRSAVTWRSHSPSIGVPGGFTQSRSRSVPSRWAERQARRTSRCELACGRTSASSLSPTAFGTVGRDPLLAARPERLPAPRRRAARGARRPRRPGAG